jgi:hypothetical protein
MASEKARAEAARAVDMLDHRKASSMDELTRMVADAALDAAAAVDGDAQREALAQFMIKHSFPTGHGDAHADLLVELDAAMQESNDGLWNAAISEAEELLRTAGGICKSSACVACADAIRSLKRLK